jgi:hypothetical protein
MKPAMAFAGKKPKGSAENKKATPLLVWLVKQQIIIP